MIIKRIAPLNPAHGGHQQGSQEHSPGLVIVGRIAKQIPRPRTARRNLISGVVERATSQGQATTANAACELLAHLL
jgi:hypothetical protein